MPFFRISSRNQTNFKNALEHARRHLTVFLAEDEGAFYVRISQKHRSTANNFNKDFGVTVDEVAELPRQFLDQTEELPFDLPVGKPAKWQLKDFLDEVSLEDLIQALAQRDWEIGSAIQNSIDEEEVETAAEMGRINSLYDPRIEEKDADILRLIGVVETLKALAY